ncbi:Alpha/Beta hydrolase protein [Mycena floridula]|nr:Alpha/Beta hydrolase protein [Mycena floridula]
MDTEKAFSVHIPDEALHLLKQKLELTTFPDELDESGSKYGPSLRDIERLVTRWKSSAFDWRKQESLINQELPQFTRDIQVGGHGNLNIHYVHKKSEVANAIPLLFVHGWPGSFLEVRKILPLLVNGPSTDPSFHVVALSLPGFGFSEAPKKQGFSCAHYAEVAHKLMLSLGYEQYVTQGGDWGFLITRKIALEYGSKHSMAWHTNYPKARAPQLLSEPVLYLRHLLTPYTAAEVAALDRVKWFGAHGRGYNEVQSTQPQTLGYSLADSPVGLLAWIHEKLRNWTDDYPWNDDEVLTWITLYWFSRAGPTASVRIYFEIRAAGDRFPGPYHVSKPTIPMGVSYFPKELGGHPRIWTSTTGNVVFRSEHTSGGHFAAHEKPNELVSDLRRMFEKGGPAFAVVPGKTGY